MRGIQEDAGHDLDVVQEALSTDPRRLEEVNLAVIRVDVRCTLRRVHRREHSSSILPNTKREEVEVLERSVPEQFPALITDRTVRCRRKRFGSTGWRTVREDDRRGHIQGSIPSGGHLHQEESECKGRHRGNIG